jgi:hypothetical protein
MRMRAKKPARRKKSKFAKYLDRAARQARGLSTRTIWVGVCSLFGAFILIGAATSNVSPDKAPAQSAAKPAATAPSTVPEAGTEPVVPPVTPTAADAVATASKSTPMTTLTGCLAREDAAYRLKDTAGDEAPRARTWKTGFLKKGAQSVDLYDTSNRAKLPTHVGQRVSVTGELVNREMYVRSVQRVSPSCSAS